MAKHMIPVFQPIRNVIEMKKLLSVLGFSLWCLAAYAQPTTFGGITPGRTTLVELKELGKIHAINDSQLVLKLPQDTPVSIRHQNGVVYEVKISESFTSEVKSSLIEKYGQPQITEGEIKKVICRNKLGTSFERYEGRKRQLWPIKDGVQGEFEFDTHVGCSTGIAQVYLLKHVATFDSIKAEKEEDDKRKAETQRRKLEGVL